jgi:hypothetical protein
VRIAAVVLVLSLALAAPAAAGRPFEPKVLGDESYAEQFSAHANLENGGYLYIQVGISNVGFGDGKGACRVLYSPPTGALWSANEKLDDDEWQYATEPYPQLQVGPCYLRGGFAVEAYAAIGGALVRMNLAAGVGSTRPPGARVDAGDDFYETELVVPWAPARVELTLPGKKRRVLNGTATLDHSRSTAMPYESARRWARFRVLSPGSSLLFVARFPPGGGGARGWLWREGEAKPSEVDRVELSRAGEGKLALWNLDFATAAGTFRVEATSLIYRDAPIENMGFGKSVVRAVVGNPVTMTMRGGLTGPGVAATGILQVSDHPK